MMVKQSLQWLMSAVPARSPVAFILTRTFSSLPTGEEDDWEVAYQRKVPRTTEELGALLRKEVNSPSDSRLLKVAVVGAPNTGKSTLINKLMSWRVCSVSSKVHTTQINARAVHNLGRTQLVFLDTPGLVTAQELSQHHLKRSLLTDAEQSLQEADLMAVVHDVADHFTRNCLHPQVMKLLTLHPTLPTVLILNKVDKTKSKRDLLEITRMLTEGIVGGKTSHTNIKKSSPLNPEKLIRRALAKESISDIRRHDDRQAVGGDVRNVSVDSKDRTVARAEQSEGELLRARWGWPEVSERDVLEGQVRLTEHEAAAFVKHRRSWPKFQEVFMLSALEGSGVEELKQFLVASANPSPWIFSAQMVTDQIPQEIVLLTVREKFLDNFNQEIPYLLHFSIEFWELSESEVLNLVVRVGCHRRGLMRMLLGGQGGTVAQLARQAEHDLRNTFRSEVRLRLNIVYDARLKKRNML